MPIGLASSDARFQSDPQWWYRFYYRIDIARGQDGFEDLYAPGWFTWDLSDGDTVQLTASLGDTVAVPVEQTVEKRRRRMAELATSVGTDDPDPWR